MRAKTIVLLPGFLFVLGAWCVDWLDAAQPTGSPSQATASDALKEMERLVGTWISVSYDCDGKVDIPLRKPQGVTLAVECFRENGTKDFAAGWWRRPIPRFGRAPDSPDSGADAGYHLSGAIEFDLSHTPKLIVLVREGQEPHRLAYEIKGDRMRLRDVGEDRAPSGELAAKKGDNWIVFNLKRVSDKAKTTLRQPAELRKVHKLKLPSLGKVVEKDQSAASGESDSREKSPLVGTWVGVSYERDGRPARKFTGRHSARLVLTAFSIAFDLNLLPDKQLRTRASGPQWDADMTKTPMEFYHLTGDESQPRVLSAIFRLDGDSLTWCWVYGEDEDARPQAKGLTTSPGDNRVLIVFRRRADKPKAPEETSPRSAGDAKDSQK